ncbi:MAG: hypothetical protein WC708_04775 [Lentisphaeria bacterium]
MSPPPSPAPLPAAPVPPPHRRRSGWAWAGLAILLALHLAWLWARFTPAIAEPDDNGYFAQGTRLAQEGRSWFLPESDAQYLGMHWLLTPSGRYLCRYPPGLSLLVAGAYGIGGWQGCLWLNPLLSVLALAGSFVLARRLLAPGWALAATAVLAANPTWLHHALAGDSHMAVTAVLVWGLVLLLCWGEQGRLWQIGAAGLVLGCIPAIRYADAVMGAGAALYVLWHGRRFPHFGRHCLAAAAGVAIPVVPLLLRNQELLGAFWRTGYSLTHEETGFGWSYFRAHAITYLRQLNGDAVGLLFALGLAGMAAMALTRDRRDTRARGVLLLGLTLPMLLVYMAYYWAPQQDAAMTLRFLLPLFPAYVLAGCWLLKETVRTRALPPAAGPLLAGGLVVFQLLWGGAEVTAQAAQLHAQKEPLARVTLALEAATAPGDVVAGSGNLLQQLDFVRRWKVADLSLLQGGSGPGGPPPGAGFGADHRPDAPSPMQAAKQTELRQKYTGTPAERRKKFLADLQAWAGTGNAIYLVGTERSLKEWDGLPEGRFQVVARVALPAQPSRRAMGGGPMMMGGGGFPPPPPDGMGGGFGGPMDGFGGATEAVIAKFTAQKPATAETSAARH